MTSGPTRRVILKSIGAGMALSAAGGLALSRPARAATTLTLSSWLPPNHPIVVNAFTPWSRQVQEVTDGRVRVRILPKPLGGAPAHFDLARDGVADITYGLHSFMPGERFLLTRAAEFSFLGDDAEALSVAYWKLHQDSLAQAGEHRGVRLLGLFTHGPGAIHNAVRPIRSVEDLRGLKFRVPGGYVGELMARLGVTALLAPSTEVYEMLANGVADGVTFTQEALTAFRLTDHLKYTTTVPGGIYNTSWFFVMNQAKWDALEDRDREAIAAISGEAFARLVGQAWIKADAVAIEKIRAAGIQRTDAGPDFVAALREHAQALETAWAEQAQARGVDGRAALARIREDTGVKLPA